jgi:uncharacterized protein YkuJ
VTILLLLSTPASTAIGGAFGGDFPGADVPARPEYVYLGLEEKDHQVTESKVPQVAKWRTASATPSGAGNSRARQLLAVSNGQVKVQGTSTWDVFDGAADPQFSTNATYVWTQLFNQKVYIGDGVSYAVYDPKAGTLSEWEAEGAGTVPEKCALAAAYRGRVVLARPSTMPTMWYMSALDEPNRWDFFPPVVTTDQAVFGNNAPAGLCPDIINALIPFDNDNLIFGCDSALWRLAGDPMEAGSFELVSDSTGVAFGRAWCKDPLGVLYFFGSKGGVYRYVAGGQPQWLSDVRDGQDVSIQDRLNSLDLTAYRIEMEWDFERQGLLVVQIPYADGNETLKAWFWDSKNNAWWEDKPGAYQVQPWAVRSVDGDQPDDRRVVYGCQDGYLRQVDANAVNDDTHAIDSSVTFGPLASGADVETMLNRAKAILAREHSGCTFEVYASDEPSRLGRIVHSGELAPGQNPRISIRRRGAYLWLVLRNTHSGQRWALEELMVDVRPMGVRKVRS